MLRSTSNSSAVVPFAITGIVRRVVKSVHIDGIDAVLTCALAAPISHGSSDRCQKWCVVSHSSNLDLSGLSWKNYPEALASTHVRWRRNIQRRCSLCRAIGSGVFPHRYTNAQGRTEDQAASGA